MYQKVTIAGVDVSAYIRTWTAERVFGQMLGSAEVNVVSTIINLLPTLDVGDEIIIERGEVTSTDYRIFRGVIKQKTLFYSTYTLLAEDKMSFAKRQEIVYSYDKDVDSEAGVGSEIWKDMFETYAGLTAGTVVSTGSVNLIDKFICNHADVFERGQAICEIYDYQQYYNPLDDTVNFEPKGYTNSSVILTVGDNIIKPLKWNYNFEECVNYATVIGAEQIVETTELYDGDGSTKAFLLSKTPHSVKVYVSSVLKTGGVIGSSSSYDYSVDKDKKQVIFVSAPGAGSENVEIRYSYKVPIPVVGYDAASIAQYCDDDNEKAYKKTYFKLEIGTVEDAKNFLQKILAKYAQPFVSTVATVDNAITIAPGQTIRVVDSATNEDRFCLIQKIKMSWPYKGDEVELGDKIWRTAEWNTETVLRIRRLEEEMGKNTDLLIHVISSERELLRERRYFKAFRRSIAGDSLIYGNANYGVWGVGEFDTQASTSFILGNINAGVLGVNKLGTNASVETLIRISQGADKYREFLYDDTFVDTGNTTATLDTANKKITF